jgi:hypothetical protein
MASDLVRVLPGELARALWESLPVEACVLCARVSRAWRAALVAAGMPAEACLRVSYFVGSPALLAWARAQARPCPWDEDTCGAIAQAGRLKTLKWARAQDPPCPWDGRTCSEAARGGHLALLEWGRGQSPRCPWGIDACAAAAGSGRLVVLRWLRSWLRVSIPCPWDESICSAAARGGHLELLRWARAEGCPWDERTCSAAARGGHLELLRWARAEGCRWSESTCAAAAAGGHLELLQWARTQAPPCPWDWRTGEGASARGHLAVLQWARAQDPPCPWDEDTCQAAAGSGHLEVLRWARAQDPPCPWSKAACETAAGAQQFEVLCWLRAQRPPCPWPKRTRALVARCCPDFAGEAARESAPGSVRKARVVAHGDLAEPGWAPPAEVVDRVLARVGLAAPGRGAPNIRLDCGHRPDESANFWLAFFGDAESAREHVRNYVLGHLYAAFAAQFSVTAWAASGEIDLLAGVEMVADRSVKFRADEPENLEVLDLARALENGGYPAYDGWTGSCSQLAETAAADAMKNLKYLVGFTQTWLRTGTLGRSVCRLSALKYAGRPAPSVFSSLVVFFAFPELPEPTGRLPLPPSEDWC